MKLKGFLRVGVTGLEPVSCETKCSIYVPLRISHGSRGSFGCNKYLQGFADFHYLSAQISRKKRDSFHYPPLIDI